MITEKEIKQIREYLKKAENPLFFYDDDPDGLASYLLLKKYIDKGTGIPIKSSPSLDEVYLRKVREHTPDYVFILDKPIISQEFVDKVNVPIIWIDHHPPIEIKGVKYFNPKKNDKDDGRPTSYWCYKITKENLWIAVCGVVGDWHIPEFIDEFAERYPDLVKKTDDPGVLLFDTDLGKLIKAFWFLLKGKVSEVRRNVSILAKIKGPYEILNQTTAKGRFVHRYVERIDKVYKKLLEEAKREADDSKVLLYIYPSTRHSLTGYLSNELLHRYPNKVVVIGRRKEDFVVMSFRSKKRKVLPILKKALEGIDGYCGGHDHACGGGVNVEDFDRFIENLRKEVT